MDDEPYDELDGLDEYDEYDDTEITIESNTGDINDIMKNYKKNKKNYQTPPALTKYERTKVLSERANQINYGSNILLEDADADKYSNAYDIAVAELNLKLIPFILKRPYGNGFEYWKLNDLL
jgi:DNA-directed RNA polymerase subunit K/omega|tara:strand:+ start:290 stop:655 length:366 start_codon:yes stop_codon:yes gene_type:complete